MYYEYRNPPSTKKVARWQTTITPPPPCTCFTRRTHTYIRKQNSAIFRERTGGIFLWGRQSSSLPLRTREENFPSLGRWKKCSMWLLLALAVIIDMTCCCYWNSFFFKTLYFFPTKKSFSKGELCHLWYTVVNVERWTVVEKSLPNLEKCKRNQISFLPSASTTTRTDFSVEMGYYYYYCYCYSPV